MRGATASSDVPPADPVPGADPAANAAADGIAGAGAMGRAVASAARCSDGRYVAAISSGAADAFDDTGRGWARGSGSGGVEAAVAEVAEVAEAADAEVDVVDVNGVRCIWMAGARPPASGAFGAVVAAAALDAVSDAASSGRRCTPAIGLAASGAPRPARRDWARLSLAAVALSAAMTGVAAARWMIGAFGARWTDAAAAGSGAACGAPIDSIERIERAD